MANKEAMNNFYTDLVAFYKQKFIVLNSFKQKSRIYEKTNSR